MQFFRTAAWVVIAVILAIFWTYNRNVPVPINLFDQVVMEVKAPVLILASFLLGMVPLWLYHRAMRWQMQRRIESGERALAALTPAVEAPAPIAPEPGDPILSTLAPMDTPVPVITTLPEITDISKSDPDKA